jgi:peroxiredoxin
VPIELSQDSIEVVFPPSSGREFARRILLQKDRLQVVTQMFSLAVKSLGLALVGITWSIALFAQVPRVTLRTTDGRLVDLVERRGRIVVLAFGATWVPMTDRDLDAFQRLADRYAGRGIDFYWVSINSMRQKEKGFVSDDGLEDFASEVGLRLPVLRDPDRTAFKTFGLDVLPPVIVIDREGQVRLKMIGLDPEESEYYDPQRKQFYTNRIYDDVIRCLNQLLK